VQKEKEEKRIDVVCRRFVERQSRAIQK